MESFIKGLTLVDIVEKLVDKINVDASEIGNENVVKDNTLILKTFGDWLRKAENRDIVIKSDKLLNILFGFMKSSTDVVVANSESEEKQVVLRESVTALDVARYEQICRVLGNLTFDHESNRAVLLSDENGGGVANLVLPLIAWIKQSRFASLKRTSITTMINLCSNDEPMQEAFANQANKSVIPTLLKLIVEQEVGSSDYSDYSDIASKALRILVEDNEEVREQLTSRDALSLYHKLQATVHNDGWIENEFAKDISAILISLEDNNDMQESLIKDGSILNGLIGFIESADSQRDMVDEIDEDDELPADGELSIAPVVSGVILKLASKDKLRPYFLSDKSKIVDRMMKIITSKPPVYSENNKKTQLKVLDASKAKRNLTRSIAYISIEDSTIPRFIKDINVFIEMLNGEDTEQLVSAAMVIGNVANSSENTQKLLSLNVIELFTKIMKTYPNHQPIQHLVLTATHNITSMKGPYKGQVAPNDLIDVVIANMIVPNQVIQFTAINVLKHLILCNDVNFVNFIKEGGLLPLANLANGVTKAGMDDDDEEAAEENSQKIRDIDENEDEETRKQRLEKERLEQEQREKAASQKKDKRVAYESSRILVRFLTMRDLLKDEDQKQSLVQECTLPFFELVHSPFSILRAEGIKALLQLVKINIETLSKNVNWWTDLSETLKASIIAPETATDKQFNQDIQLNIYEILMELIKNDDKCKELKSLGAVATLKELSKLPQTNATTKSNLQKILSQLTI
ncbi:darlin [Heterostelium album PN500]|uniref:Darlin n=1 Tax=Heterostelium pallidum (strain ATCC 26659 / Pp 5 / PN500) TaxID=670386 RepID=D3BNX1_HETP5|nr:darlin [Heterostelium album PN500]EFA76890.1 darlin [Heterostelium album PN500]|eukprot:XP_020429022.1 darlin [Heterostelium album PN500]